MGHFVVYTLIDTARAVVADFLEIPPKYKLARSSCTPVSKFDSETAYSWKRLQSVAEECPHIRYIRYSVASYPGKVVVLKCRNRFFVGKGELLSSQFVTRAVNYTYSESLPF